MKKEERLITIKEVSEILNISEDKIKEFTEKGQIPAYKIGGIYLRFKREEIEKLRNKFSPEGEKNETSDLKVKDSWTFSQKIKEFFYFYDFYILCFLIIILLLTLIFIL